eukprot:jgi/Botrbrau1/4749/Bobra.0137s0021.1
MAPEKFSDIPTTQRWWQTKRVPLYVATAAGFAYLFAWQRHMWTKDPTAAAQGDSRKAVGHPDEVPEMSARQGVAYSEESPSKKMVRAAGMEPGQDTGIFPNAKITKKLDDMGVLPGGGDWKPRV